MKKILIESSELSKEIHLKIREIATSLSNNQEKEINLFGGKTGHLLFWSYYSLLDKSYNLENSLIPTITEIMKEIRMGNTYSTFSGGLAGIGWTLEHLKHQRFISIDSDKILKDVDYYLYKQLRIVSDEGYHDYLRGSMGIVLYYLNRLTNSDAKSYIAELILTLKNQAQQFSNGIAWESTMYYPERKSVYNLGLSHGIASMIAILSNIYQAKIDVERVRNLVEKAINFLLIQKLDSSNFKYSFPAYFDKKLNVHSGEGRLAWCYNDLGISMAILRAGIIFNNLCWKDLAVEILLKTTEITEWKEAKVMDAGLCHGTSGIAHIYNRAFEYTGIEKFKISAIFWFKQSLKMAVFQDGLAGYKTYRASEFGGSCNENGLLTGIAGIGLAMISAVSDIEPAWDRALLLS